MASRIVEVSGRDVGAAKLDLAGRAVGDDPARRIDQPHLGHDLRLADRADLLRRVGAVHQERARARLGHAHAVADDGALGEKRADEVDRQRRAAGAPVADAAEIERAEARMQADRLIDRGHAEEDADRTALDQLDDGVDVEFLEHMARSAGDEHGQRVQVDAGRVEQRQIVDRAVLRPEAGCLLHVDVVRERHARRLDHGFRPARRAGRVEEIPDALRGPGRGAVLPRLRSTRPIFRTDRT